MPSRSAPASPRERSGGSSPAVSSSPSQAPLPPSFCEAVIGRCEAAPHQQQRGRIGQTGSLEASVKNTSDRMVSNKDDWLDVDAMLFRSLAGALQEFREAFPYFRGPFKDLGYQVQRYLPGGIATGT